jgi:hypothetical protein
VLGAPQRRQRLAAWLFLGAGALACDAGEGAFDVLDPLPRPLDFGRVPSLGIGMRAQFAAQAQQLCVK